MDLYLPPIDGFPSTQKARMISVGWSDAQNIEKIIGASLDRKISGVSFLKKGSITS
jgi:hypothetical protein